MTPAEIKSLDWCDPVGVLELLAQRGVSTTELADAIGCSRNHVRALQGGTATYIALESLPRLRDFAATKLADRGAWPWPVGAGSAGDLAREASRFTDALMERIQRSPDQLPAPEAADPYRWDNFEAVSSRLPSPMVADASFLADLAAPQALPPVEKPRRSLLGRLLFWR